VSKNVPDVQLSFKIGILHLGVFRWPDSDGGQNGGQTHSQTKRRASRTRLGLSPYRFNLCQASVSSTLIGRFKGRAIRDVSHQSPAGLPSPPPLGLLVGLRITGCPAADPLPGVTRFPRKRVRWPVVSWGRGGTCMIVVPLRGLRPNLTRSACCSDPMLKARRRSRLGRWPLVRAAPTARGGRCPRTQ